MLNLNVCWSHWTFIRTDAYIVHVIGPSDEEIANQEPVKTGEVKWVIFYALSNITVNSGTWAIILLPKSQPFNPEVSLFDATNPNFPLLRGHPQNRIRLICRIGLYAALARMPVIMT